MVESSSFLECDDCLCAAARREALRLGRLYDDRLRPHGLTSNQFTLLATLIRTGPTRMNTLAERLGIDRTTLSRNINLGEDRGLLTVAAGKDARERLVTLTDKGRATALAALPAWRAAQAEAEGA
jgi:DNA-binding MarR family transcriptional regulator